MSNVISFKSNENVSVGVVYVVDDESVLFKMYDALETEDPEGDVVYKLIKGGKDVDDFNNLTPIAYGSIFMKNGTIGYMITFSNNLSLFRKEFEGLYEIINNDLLEDGYNLLNNKEIDQYEQVEI